MRPHLRKMKTRSNILFIRESDEEMAGSERRNERYFLIRWPLSLGRRSNNNAGTVEWRLR